MKDGTKLETVSVNKEFNNPAGKFSTVQYKVDSPASEIDGVMYVVPFIGIVYLEMHNPFASAVSGDTVMVRLELIDFKIDEQKDKLQNQPKSDTFDIGLFYSE